MADGKKKKSIKRKDLDRLLDAAARAWLGHRNPDYGDASPVKHAVTMWINVGQPAAACAFIVVAEFEREGRTRSILGLLLRAAQLDWREGRIGRDTNGLGWKQIFEDEAVIAALEGKD